MGKFMGKDEFINVNETLILKISNIRYVKIDEKHQNLIFKLFNNEKIKVHYKHNLNFNLDVGLIKASLMPILTLENIK